MMFRVFPIAFCTTDNYQSTKWYRAGIIESLGENVSAFKIGDRVTAMTRFGGYAEYTVTNELATARIPGSIDFASATALATQYCTAYYSASIMTNLFEGDKVLIQSGA